MRKIKLQLNKLKNSTEIPKTSFPNTKKM